MPGLTDRVHFEDEVLLRKTKLDSIQEDSSQSYKQRVEEILNPNSTYLTELQGPDELGEDFGFEPEDADFIVPSGSEADYIDGLDDPMLDKIKGEIAKDLRRQESESSETSSRTEDSRDQEAELNIHYSEHFTSVPYGVLPRATYSHGRKNADIMGIVYNGRMRQFVILDGKGITTWKRDPGLNGERRIQRSLMYPKYEYRLISYLVYAKKFNCYFALGKDFSLKVLNRDFIETCSVSANLRSVLFMLFNPVGDELITGGVGGTTIWKFEQDASKQLTEIKPLANYRLRRVRDLKDVGGSWVKRVDLDLTLQHLYCCSDTDLYAYDLRGQLLFKFLKAHTMSITGCIYSQFSKTLLTCSIDTEVKMWSLRGGLVHTFRGHSRAVTSLVVHPVKTSIIVTASLDGSVKMWSLNTMEILYSVVISTDGLLWMGMTDDSLMFCATVRNITLWNLNQFYDFFAVARSRICRLSLASCENKTTRVVAEGQDSSMRLFSRKSQKNLTTVLPPPDISPLQRVLSVCYSREYNMVFVLITTMEIWVYTTKTDPSCRVMTWNVHDLQTPYLSNKGKKDSDNPLGGWSSSLQGGPSHRATENGLGNEVLTTCHSLCILTSTATMWTEEGFCCPIQNMDLEETYLLMGMEDGRILFMDPVTKGKKYLEFKASKDAIQEMRHDISHNALITMCHLKELAMIQIWSLPQLELLHELYCSLNIACYSRMDTLFMTGHFDGCVNFYTLEPAEDWGLFRAKIEPNKDSVVKKKRPEHNAEVVAIDSSASMRIFCSASLNGVIRIWDENKHLMTEIFMDKLEIDDSILQEEPGRKKLKVDEQGRKEKVEEDDEEDNSTSFQEKSLSAACFLNNKGDLIIGYKNHIFFIDHTKVCPHLSVTEEEEEIDKESAIIEDPSVIYEGGVYLPEAVTLENYLVPFDFIDFSKDFLEGKIDLEETSEEEEDSGSESSLSLAPTEIYQSPLDSPWSRSMIDLTLDSEINKHDLRQRMNLTMDEIYRRAEEDFREARTSRDRYLRRKMLFFSKLRSGKKRRKAVSILNGDDTPRASDQESEGENQPKFDFPMFGTSPGPSPVPTPPSHPATPEVEEVVEEVETQTPRPLDDNFVLKEVPAEESFGHLPPAELDYTSKHPPLPIKMPAKDLESLSYPDQKITKLGPKETVPPDSPISSPSLASHRGTSAHTDSKSRLTPTFERVPTPDTLVSEWSSQWSEDVQIPRIRSNSTLNFPFGGLKSTETANNTNTQGPTDSVDGTANSVTFEDQSESHSDKKSKSKKSSKSKHDSPRRRRPSKQSERDERTSEVIDPTKQQQQVETKTDSSDEEEVIPDRRNKYRLDNIKLDVKGLMKSAKPTVRKAPHSRKTDPSPARSDHTHVKQEEQLLTPEELARKQVEEERRLERLKKQMLKERKFPKRGNKPTRAELLAEQKRLEELKKEHPYGVAPQLTQQLNKKPLQEEKKEDGHVEEKEDYPLVQYEQPDLDSFQDEQWNPRETGVSGTSLMGTKLDLPQIKRGAAGTPGPRIIKPPPTPLSRGATPLPPENNGYLQVPSTPTPGSRLEFPTEIDRPPEELRRELHSRQGRISPLKGVEEVDRDTRTPDIETAVQRQWSVQNDIPERPRSETPTAALKKLSDSRKGAPKLIRVDLPKESDGKLDTYRTRLASPISEMTEDRSHWSGHEADDELGDHHRHRKHYKSRKERSLLTKEELKYVHQRPNSSFHRPKPAETQEDVVRPRTAHVRFQAESPEAETEAVNIADLQNAFEDALERYNSLHGVPSTDKNKLLYKNDGNSFEDNWQEREIERHMLLRMKKALRSKSAAQKRQAWEDQLEEKRQKLQQRDVDAQSAIGLGMRSETVASFFALSQVERANTAMSFMPHLSTANPTVQLPRRPKTAAANLQKQQTDKTALKVEKPFRYKIRQGESETSFSRPPSRQSSEPSLSPRMIDPRNPNSLRPPSTKSIPSKCTRYILVSKQKRKPAMPLPTPLEEHLLAERFPTMGEKVYRQHTDLAVRSKKPTYCVEYTPFVNQWT